MHLLPRASIAQKLVSASRSRIIRVLCVLALLYGFYVYEYHQFLRFYTGVGQRGLTSPLISFLQLETTPSPLTGLLALETAASVCKTQSWAPWPEQTRRRKVYDLLMVNDEMDWLFIRLSTLSPVVDYFVIVESPVTFTGREKPLVLRENWERFKEWHGQIIYHVLENPPMESRRTWDYEDFQRNAMFLQTFGKLEGEKKAEMGDVLLVSDVDEIPKPATVMLLRNCDAGKRVTIRSHFYYYGFQWKHIGEQWAHPQATIFEGEKTILPVDLRNGEGGNRLIAWWQKKEIWNAGWHCSTCFDTIEEVHSKMKSFSHTPLNAERFRDPSRIVDRVGKGLDLWDREGEEYQRIEKNDDIPEVVKNDPKRWGYLLQRDGPSAGFTDYRLRNSEKT